MKINLHLISKLNSKSKLIFFLFIFKSHNDNIYEDKSPEKGKFKYNKKENLKISDSPSKFNSLKSNQESNVKLKEANSLED